jgi:hypothetical protein
MPFCVTCGSSIQGRFCEKCGAPAGAAGAPAAAPVMAAGPAPVAATAPRKTSPLVWILGGLGLLVVLFVGMVVVGGIFVVHKARQAGLDPALWQRNPGVAATKMIVAANPDAEIVSLDERGGVIVVRDKKTGKTVKMNFADIKRGRMSLEADGESVDLSAAGDGRSTVLQAHTKDGVASFAAGDSVKLPAWIPAYAGATETGGISTNSAQGEAGTYGFKTSDSPAAVQQFYEGALKKSGFAIQNKIEAGETSMLMADNAEHSVNVGASRDGGQTSVTISFSQKTK